jgi:hypothetical protein
MGVGQTKEYSFAAAGVRLQAEAMIEDHPAYGDYVAWILTRNLGAWCDAVSHLFGTALTDREREGIRCSVSMATGAKPFRFRLGASDSVEVSACLDQPNDVAHVWIDPSPLDTRIEVITMMCQSFRIEGAITRFEEGMPGTATMVVVGSTGD